MLLHDSHRKGICSELLAKEYFIKKGYLVFSPENAAGPIDLITLDEQNNICFYDVKTNNLRKNGKKIYRANNKVKGINIVTVYVDVETKEIIITNPKGAKLDYEME
jgi:hypothetical protein